MNHPLRQKPSFWDRNLYPLLLSFALVAFFRMLFGDIWPLYWPDEALFSSPAASLAQTGRFATPVLAGLIPGMERATLWNSPLYMFLLAQLYRLTGESLLVGRSLSMLIAFFCLFIFAKIIWQRRQEKRIVALALVSLALDLAFLRSANTARMDMLTLLWVLLTVLFFTKEHVYYFGQALPLNREAFFGKISLSSRIRYFWSGVFIGLAALSHPIAILLLPLSAIYVLPRLRPFLWIFLGGLTGLLPWLVYILRYPDLFLLQFRMQLERKGDIFSLFGGDTGGAFKVFLSQYGGGKIPMMLAALWIGTLSLVLCLYFWKYFLDAKAPDREKFSGTKQAPRGTEKEKGFLAVLSHLLFSHELWVRHSLAFFCVLGIVILSSEGWYALYVGPFFLLALASLPIPKSAQKELPFVQKDFARRTFYLIKSSFLQRPLVFYFAFVFLLAVFFGLREIFLWKKAKALSVWKNNVLENTKPCRRIYLRLRPDPYFLLRKHRPALSIREFIPGKLKLPVGYEELRQSYDKIDCFLVNREMDWEPLLKRYLREKKDGFQVLPLKQPPLEDAFLWIRLE